jgi:arylsulfatase A-like enzyme
VGIGSASLLIPPTIFALSKNKKPGGARPNILYIMADDHDANFVGSYKSWIKEYVDTPTIDKLAAEGARLTNCFCTNSLCAPSRATIISGKYSHKSGVYTLREDMNTSGWNTLPVVMKNAGYQTAAVGKWHVHGDNMHGLDYYSLTRTSQGRYINPSMSTPDGKRNEEGHSSDVYTNISLEWLEKRDKTKPFFLMHHFKAAHGPWQYAPRYEKLYADIDIPEPPTLHDDYSNRFEGGIGIKKSKIFSTDGSGSLSTRMQGLNKKGEVADWPTGNLDVSGMSDSEIKKATYQKYVKDYLRCVKGIDDNVLRLIEYLEHEGILDDTLIIYTSDQGMYVGEHGFYDKRLGLDEGMRMPFIARYPKEIQAGIVLDDIVNNVDFPETMIDYAGAEIPADMQGFSFRKNLREDPKAHQRSATFYAFYSSGTPRHYGIRTKQHKLLKYMGKDGSVIGQDLFDMVNDPNELRSVLNDKSYSKILTELEQQLAEEMKAIDLTEKDLPGRWKAPARKVKPKKKKKKNKQKKS